MTLLSASTPPANRSGILDVRRANLVRVLGALRELGPVSRAGLAGATGLTKATVSAVVLDLASRRLVAESGLVRQGALGRPGRLLDLGAAPVRALGVEVNTDHLTAVVLDLAGTVRCRVRVDVDVRNGTASAALDRVATLIGEVLNRTTAEGGRVLGLTVSVPGLVQSDAATVMATPNLPLSGTDVPEQLWRRLGTRLTDVSVRVSNDADLAAMAEHRIGTGGDLVYLTGEVGVGAGIVVGGRVLRGSAGFAGEIGHLPVPGASQRCGCGRVGCLETVAGLAALLRAGEAGDRRVATVGERRVGAHGDRRLPGTAERPALTVAEKPRPGTDLAGDPADRGGRLAELDRRAARDPEIRAALARAGRALGYGVSVLVNVLDPARVVLGGAFAVLAHHLIPAAEAELRRRVVLPGPTGHRLVASAIGPDASALGAATSVLDRIFADPAAVPAGAPLSAGSSAPAGPATLDIRPTPPAAPATDHPEGASA